MSEQEFHASTLWYIIPDFTFESAYPGNCTVTGLPRRDGDVGVFRPLADNGIIEGEGYIDIAQIAVEDAARLLGWKSADEVEAEVRLWRERANNANLEKGRLKRKITSLEAQLAEAKGEDL